MMFRYLLVVCLAYGFAASSAWADACSDANTLHAQALRQPDLDKRAKLLEQTTALCPSHAQAWNNLGYLREQQGRMPEAEKHYRRAIQVDPSFAAAYAGLGDMLDLKRDYAQAAANYQLFLTQVDKEIRRGDPYRLRSHRAAYEKKLAKVTAKLGKGEVTAGEVISADEITRSLLGNPRKTRGNMRVRAIHPRYKDTPAIDVRIQFEFGSHAVHATSAPQVDGVVQALKNPQLRGSRIKIVGHTDNVGSAESNLTLSQRRAASVRDVLVARGVPASMLLVEGVGMSEPVEPNDTALGRANNRRVTFVNMKR